MLVGPPLVLSSELVVSNDSDEVSDFFDAAAVEASDVVALNGVADSDKVASNDVAVLIGVEGETMLSVVLRMVFMVTVAGVQLLISLHDIAVKAYTRKDDKYISTCRSRIRDTIHDNRAWRIYSLHQKISQILKFLKSYDGT